MGSPVMFPGVNLVLGPPAGREDVGTLPVFRQPDGPCLVSCWELDGDELRDVLARHRVFVSVLGGRSMPPIYLGSEESVRRVVIDSGSVWRRAE